MKNVRKHRDIKLVTTEKRREYLALESNHHTKKCFTEHLSPLEIRKQTCL